MVVGGHEGLVPQGDEPAVTPGDTREAGIQHELVTVLTSNLSVRHPASN